MYSLGHYFAPHELAWIYRLYDEGLSMGDIAKLFERDPSVISRVMKDAKVKIRTGKHSLNRPYTVNHHYFGKIDTHEKAYFLGWMFSDGCVSFTNNTISLTTNDIEVLEWFKRELECNKEIDHNSVSIECYLLSFSSEIMKRDLIALGCVPRKSLILEFPWGKFDEKYLWSFTLGYFEGDGMMCVTRKTKQLKIISSTMFVTEMKKFLQSEGLKVNAVTNDVKTHKPETSYFRISGSSSLKLFYEKAYAQCRYALLRKKHAFERLKIFSTDKCAA